MHHINDAACDTNRLTAYLFISARICVDKTVILTIKATTKPQPTTNKSKTAKENISHKENQPTIHQMPW